MLGRYVLACLIGLGCGVANAAYLLLVLHATSVARGIWRNLLVASWLVHVGWPVLLVMFVVLRPFVERGARNEELCVIYCWVPLSAGALIWYLRTHPNPLQIDWGRRHRYRGQSPMPDCSVTELAAVKRGTVRSQHVLHCSLAAAGCGVGLALYLLLSRPAFLHYYLAALGCGVGLALYLLIVLRTIRVTRGRRRRLLSGMRVPTMLLYFALVLAFRVAGSRLGVADGIAAELGVPFLLGAPALGAAIWYVSKYPSLRRTDPTRDGV